MSPVRILIADDHAIIRSGLRALLAHEPGFEIVAEAADGREAVELAERELPHVAILDISMPTLNGLEAARQISGKLTEIQIVMLTVHTDECYLLNALKAGARGYVLKSSAEFEIVEAIRAVAQGKAYFSPKVSRVLADEYMRYLQASQVEDSYDLLTSRERQILQLLAEGQSNKDIASILDLSPTTVICHRQHIFQKLNLHSLADLILYAIRKGVISSHQSAVV
ncbi:Two component transcriptional regulator, LuxR family [Candidatus Sulfopaludibacter sp. SbA3]|nr:Two component transcriptional regulator, LuxR family [Candidatus Sulfopaludibacter sp. SbA3]